MTTEEELRVLQQIQAGEVSLEDVAAGGICNALETLLNDYLPVLGPLWLVIVLEQFRTELLEAVATGRPFIGAGRGHPLTDSGR